MRAFARAAALLALGAWSGSGASAEDAPPALPPGEVEFALRTDVTPFDPGKPAAEGFAAYVEDGWGVAEAARAAVAADAEGRVRLPFRGPGGTALVWARGRAPVAVRVNAPVAFAIPLAPALAAEIRVTSAAGAPISGAEVSAEALLPVVHPSAGAPDAHRVRAVARTDGNGAARFAGLADAPLAVAVRADGWADQSLFPVDPGKGATIVLGRGSRVAGTLRLLPDAVPATGATARLGPRGATVGADGAFEFRSVPPGLWTLRFEGPGFVAPPTRTLVLEDGTDRTGLDATALRTSTFTGRLEGSGPAGPLRLVVTYPPATGLPETSAEAALGPDGRFSAAGLPPCDGASVLVSAPGFVAARLEGVSLPPGAVAREVDVRLVAAGRAKGVLADLAGARLAGVTVASATGPPPLRREHSRTVTDADGTFVLDGIPPGERWLRVVGRPLGGETPLGPWTFVAGETRDLGTLAAFAGFALRGRAPGAPDGTTVVASRDGADLARVPTAFEAFEIAGLPAGPVELRLEKDGEAAGSAAAAVPAAWPVTVPYDGPVVVRGRVIDGDGRPVAAATVRAERLDGEGIRMVEVRDPSGGFEVRAARGRWRLSASAGLEGDAGIGGSIEAVLPEDSFRGLVLTLERGASLRGVVASAEDGRPLEGAVVAAETAGDGRRVASAVADAAGRFRIAGLPEGAVRVRVVAADRGDHVLEPRAVRAADEIDLGRIEVPRGTTVRGEVVGDGGVPLPRAEVTFESERGTVRTARTDAHGRYAAAGVPPGPSVLRVRSEGGALLSASRVEVPWTWDDWRLRIDVAAGTRIRGRVRTGGRGEPFARVVVRTTGPAAAESSAVADGAGNFVLGPLPAGAGEIEVVPAGALAAWRAPFAVRGGFEQHEDVDLPESGVAGRVEAYEGGAGVAGAFVELREPGADRAVAAAVSGDDGSFLLPRVPPSRYELVARRAGYGLARVRDLEVRRNRDRTGVRVVLPPEASIVVAARDGRFRPVSSAWALARAEGAGPSGPVVAASADAEGRIVLRGLARGGWRISVGAPGLGTRELGVVAADEGVRDVGDVRLERGAVLRVDVPGAGRGRFGGAGPVAVGIEDVFGLDPRPPRRPDDPFRGPDPVHVAGADGIVEIPGLAPGTYRVFPAGRPDAAIRVRLREDTVLTVRLPFPEEPPGPEPGAK